MYMRNVEPCRGTGRVGTPLPYLHRQACTETHTDTHTTSCMFPTSPLSPFPFVWHRRIFAGQSLLIFWLFKGLCWLCINMYIVHKCTYYSHQNDDEVTSQSPYCVCYDCNCLFTLFKEMEELLNVMY